MNTFPLFSRFVDTDEALGQLGLSEASRLEVWAAYQAALARAVHPEVVAAAWVRPGIWLRTAEGTLLQVGWPVASLFREAVMVPARAFGAVTWATRQWARSEPAWWMTAEPLAACEVDPGEDFAASLEALESAFAAAWASEKGLAGLRWLEAAPGWVEQLWASAEPRIRALLPTLPPQAGRPPWVFAHRGGALVPVMAADLARPGIRLVEPSRRGLAEVRQVVRQAPRDVSVFSALMNGWGVSE